MTQNLRKQPNSDTKDKGIRSSIHIQKYVNTWLKHQEWWILTERDDEDVLNVHSKTKLSFRSRRGAVFVSSKHFHFRLHGPYISSAWHAQKGPSCLPPFYIAEVVDVSDVEVPFFLIHAAGEVGLQAEWCRNGLYILFIVALLGFDKERCSWGRSPVRTPLPRVSGHFTAL